jgi:hypothetical protein
VVVVLVLLVVLVVTLTDLRVVLQMAATTAEAVEVLVI